ncbi:hypothetical protein BKA70DRAFT_488955 [Coprinopsis sp. MPI-PUGE-AT-0042]|nr:hypothetical protein BKA70DRAFT_488955 [Coprinopsis sp. MPI-PUGE-AT-0042]
MHSPLVSHQEVPVSGNLRNSRLTSSLLKDNAECPGGMILSSSTASDMARMASNEGRRGTEAGLWVLLSTMTTHAIIISIRCSQTVCSGSIVRPRPARLVLANRGHPNPTTAWPARDTLTALARRATTTLAHQPCMLRSRMSSVMAHSLPLHRVSRHPRGVTSGTRARFP